MCLAYSTPDREPSDYKVFIQAIHQPTNQPASQPNEQTITSGLVQIWRRLATRSTRDSNDQLDGLYLEES